MYVTDQFSGSNFLPPVEWVPGVQQPECKSLLVLLNQFSSGFQYIFNS
jgi:hypothetical protein